MRVNAYHLLQKSSRIKTKYALRFLLATVQFCANMQLLTHSEQTQMAKAEIDFNAKLAELKATQAAKDDMFVITVLLNLERVIAGDWEINVDDIDDTLSDYYDSDVAAVGATGELSDAQERKLGRAQLRAAIDVYGEIDDKGETANRLLRLKKLLLDAAEKRIAFVTK
jgi:hypothetical protein